MPRESILKVLADNPPLLDEVKRVLLEQFTYESKLHVGMTNEELGEVVRASLVGIKKVEDAFKVVAQYKSEERKPEPLNPAR